MITVEERESLKAEILEEVEKTLKGKVIREDVSTTLKEPREFWFVKRTVDGKRVNGKMHECIDSITAWAIWELIRKLTCYICGVSYVRHLNGKNVKVANEIAETLCQTVYDLRIKYLDEEKGHDADET